MRGFPGSNRRCHTARLHHANAGRVGTHPLRQVRAEFYSPLDESLQGVTVELAATDAALTFASPIPTAKVSTWVTTSLQSPAHRRAEMTLKTTVGHAGGALCDTADAGVCARPGCRPFLGGCSSRSGPGGEEATRIGASSYPSVNRAARGAAQNGRNDSLSQAYPIMLFHAPWSPTVP